MAAIAETIIERPLSRVWEAFADCSAHSRWLGEGATTQIEGGTLAEGKKFWRTDARTGKKVEGEIVTLNEPRLLKVRSDLSPDCFSVTEYHLIALDKRCIVRIVMEIYDTGQEHHAFFPEPIEQQLADILKRLKQYCEGN